MYAIRSRCFRASVDSNRRPSKFCSVSRPVEAARQVPAADPAKIIIGDGTFRSVHKQICLELRQERSNSTASTAVPGLPVQSKRVSGVFETEGRLRSAVASCIWCNRASNLCALLPATRSTFSTEARMERVSCMSCVKSSVVIANADSMRMGSGAWSRRDAKTSIIQPFVKSVGSV